MNTGDEPQLGGHNTDNAPMISSAATRANVNPRGAYMVGNLTSLIRMLDQEQEQVLRTHLLLQTLSVVEPLLLPEHEAERQALTLFRENASSPMEAYQRASNILDQARIQRLHSELYSDEYPELWSLHDAVEDIRSSVATEMMIGAAALTQAAIGKATEVMERRANPERHFYRSGSRAKEQAEWMARCWQVEAVWSILNNRSIIPYTEFIADAVEQQYRSGDLAALLTRLSANQNLRFKRTMVETALLYASQVLPPEDADIGERQCISVAQNWLQNPTLQAISEATAATEAYNTAVEQGQSHDQDVHYNMRLAAVHTAGILEEGNLFDASQNARSALSCAFEQLCKPDNYYEIDDCLKWWQLEVAWAILHDDIVQPLELTQVGERRSEREPDVESLGYLEDFLSELMDVLTDEKQQRFHHILVEQTFVLAERVLPLENPSERRAFEELRLWLDDRNLIHTHAARNLLAARNPDVEDFELKIALMIFRGIVTCMESVEIGYAASSEQRLAYWVKRLELLQTGDPFRLDLVDHISHPESRAAESAAFEWQLEVVSALLHDEEVPPFM